VTPRQANAATGIGLVAFMAALAFTAPRWAAFLRSTTAATVEGEEAAGEPSPSPSPDAEAARRIRVRLYFEAPDRAGLLPEEREVVFSSDLARQLRTVLEELAKGSTTGLLSTLPAGTRVLEVFVNRGGVAYVDLSGEAASGLPGGSQAELLTVYSVVNTVVTNFPATSRVHILVNDQVVPSLGGHVDLARPLSPDMTLLALPSPSSPPEASPSVAPGAPTPPAAGAPPAVPVGGPRPAPPPRSAPRRRVQYARRRRALR
jgi:germination protein M